LSSAHSEEEKGMARSVRAAGAYLLELRKRKGWSRADVVQAIEHRYGDRVGGSTVKRVEEGGANASGSIWAMMNDVLGGDIVHLDQLLRSPDAPPDAGVRLAEELLASLEASAGADADSDEERTAALLLALYNDAVARRDLEAQEEALKALRRHRAARAAPPE
jgi:transcriptional regulator with XRE-family HTH domain